MQAGGHDCTGLQTLTPIVPQPAPGHETHAVVPHQRQVEVVFVNFHSEALVAPRAKLLEDAGFPAVVVDNSSTYSGPGKVVRPGANLGFGAACNRALEALDASTTAVCLHNPDVDATPDDVGALLDALGRQVRPGLVSPAVKSGNRLRLAGFHYPSPLREAYLSWRGVRARRGPDRRPSISDRVRLASVEGRRFGSAAFMMADVAALRDVGGFDERYFLYVEDLDLWHRICKSGYQADFCADVVVTHATKRGSPMSAAVREILRWVGVELFEERRGGAWRTCRLVHVPPLAFARKRGGLLAEVVLERWVRWQRPSTVATAVVELMRSPAPQ